MRNEFAFSHYSRKVNDLVQSTKKYINMQYRLMTCGKRSKPDFLIIGAMKSGTTSLFSYLSQHPQIIPSDVKEVHFFDGGRDGGSDEYQRGPSFYRAHFPFARELADGKQTFEATPSYIFHPLAPERIHETLPNVKMIVLLRDPTQRAISHFFHQKRRGIETLPIMEAFQQEETRLRPILESNDYFNLVLREFSYKLRGHYADQFERYFKFFRREQLMILSSEDFFANTQNCLNQIFAFLNLKTNVKINDMAPKFVAKNKEVVSPDVVDYLNNYFEPKNKILYRLLDTDFNWGKSK